MQSFYRRPRHGNHSGVVSPRFAICRSSYLVSISKQKLAQWKLSPGLCCPSATCAKQRGCLQQAAINWCQLLTAPTGTQQCHQDPRIPLLGTLQIHELQTQETAVPATREGHCFSDLGGNSPTFNFLLCFGVSFFFEKHDWKYSKTQTISAHVLLDSVLWEVPELERRTSELQRKKCFCLFKSGDPCSALGTGGVRGLGMRHLWSDTGGHLGLLWETALPYTVLNLNPNPTHEMTLGVFVCLLSPKTCLKTQSYFKSSWCHQSSTLAASQPLSAGSSAYSFLWDHIVRTELR